MQYAPMPAAMWLLFQGSFRKQLEQTLQYSSKRAKEITSRAKTRYKSILADLPEFEKQDMFKMNLLSCAMLCAFLEEMDRRVEVNELSEYYEKSMMTPVMNLFCRISGKRKFSKKSVDSVKAAAALHAAERNPYSWNLEYIELPDGYEARFTRCGICTLMKEHGFYDLVPAMCHLDYSMNAAAKANTAFEREYTLASGGPYCDCRYLKKQREV
jgi:hypothetical protein